MFIWHYWHVELRNTIRWIRYAEMQVAAPFLPSDYEVEFKEFKGVRQGDPYQEIYRSMQYRRDQYKASMIPFHKQLDKVPEYKTRDLNYRHMALFSAMAMQPLKMVFVYILGAGAMWCLFLGPTTQYRRRLSLEDLIRVQSSVFPVISPFVNFDPGKQPPRPPGAPVPAELPSFAEALGPEEWIAYNSIPIPDGKLDEDATREAFIRQLGPRWKGPNGLAPHKKILLAAFCLKAARKRGDADDMLGNLARCWTHEHGFEVNKKLLKKAEGILKNKDLAGKTLAVCNQHAFETTAILRGMAFAREQGGVLAPATFVWLRAHDRVLWYPLNNLGRQSFHMEAVGAMSHFKAEKLTRRPIPVPKVDGAIQTIKAYMGSMRARPVPQLDYSKSKKRGVKKAV